MNLLTTDAEIKAAIAMMNPVTDAACRIFVARLVSHPSLLDNMEDLQEACCVSCLIAMDQAGWDLDNNPRVTRFIEDHVHSVMTVGISIIMKIINDAEARKKWGWIGKAAAVGAGVIIGSFFG